MTEKYNDIEGPKHLLPSETERDSEALLGTKEQQEEHVRSYRFMANHNTEATFCISLITELHALFPHKDTRYTFSENCSLLVRQRLFTSVKWDIFILLYKKYLICFERRYPKIHTPDIISKVAAFKKRYQEVHRADAQLRHFLSTAPNIEVNIEPDYYIKNNGKMIHRRTVHIYIDGKKVETSIVGYASFMTLATRDAQARALDYLKNLPK